MTNLGPKLFQLTCFVLGLGGSIAASLWLPKGSGAYDQLMLACGMLLRQGFNGMNGSGGVPPTTPPAPQQSKP